MDNCMLATAARMGVLTFGVLIGTQLEALRGGIHPLFDCRK